VVVAVLSVQDLGLGFENGVLLLQDLHDEIFAGGFGVFLAQTDRPTSGESSRAGLLFNRIRNNMDSVGNDTDEFSSGMIRAGNGRPDGMAKAVAVTLVWQVEACIPKTHNCTQEDSVLNEHGTRWSISDVQKRSRLSLLEDARCTWANTKSQGLGLKRESRLPKRAMFRFGHLARFKQHVHSQLYFERSNRNNKTGGSG
jgi:hypothetical protein